MTLQWLSSEFSTFVSMKAKAVMKWKASALMSCVLSTATVWELAGYLGQCLVRCGWAFLTPICVFLPHYASVPFGCQVPV